MNYRPAADQQISLIICWFVSNCVRGGCSRSLGHMTGCTGRKAGWWRQVLTHSPICLEILEGRGSVLTEAEGCQMTGTAHAVSILVQNLDSVLPILLARSVQFSVSSW